VKPHTRWEFGNPAHCAAFVGYTTEALNTHKTDKRTVLYPWHPFYGRSLPIAGQRNRRGAIVLICTPEEVNAPSVLKIPEWMFDRAVCCRFRSASVVSVDLSALRGLRALLEGASGYGNDVIEAQHRSTNSGGSDAQATEDESDTVHAVSTHPSSSFPAGGDPSQINETHFIPMFIGIALGIAAGTMPIAFPGLPQPVRLGLAGGH
jgi:hypothetical protein